MKKIEIKSKSSSGSFYLVEFLIDKNIKVNCNCNAGIFGKLCKHKIGFLETDYSLLFDKNDKYLLDDLKDYVGKSEFPKLVKELNFVKNEIVNAKRNEKKLKLKLERVLREGMNYIE